MDGSRESAGSERQRAASAHGGRLRGTAAGLLRGLPYLPPVAPAPVQPSAPMAEDLRALSDFLFECKDVVEEGAYLAASNALKRVWDRAI